MSVKLILTEILDRYVRENFKILEQYLNSKFLLNFEFKLFDQSFSENGTFTIPHGLGIVPLDVIQTSKKGTGSIAYNYASFDATNLSITISGASTSDPVVVRALVGTYREQ